MMEGTKDKANDMYANTKQKILNYKEKLNLHRMVFQDAARTSFRLSAMKFFW